MYPKHFELQHEVCKRTILSLYLLIDTKQKGGFFEGNQTIRTIKNTTCMKFIALTEKKIT
jgi:hypothetical protein